MKKKSERMDKQINEIMAENKILTESLRKAREEMEELRIQVRMTDIHSKLNMNYSEKYWLIKTT